MSSLLESRIGEDVQDVQQIQEVHFFEGRRIKNGEGEVIWSEGPVERRMYILEGYHHYIGTHQLGAYDGQPETVVFRTFINASNAHIIPAVEQQEEAITTRALTLVPNGEPVPITNAGKLRRIK